MGVEIERKFLVHESLVPQDGPRKVIKQGYLVARNHPEVVLWIYSDSASISFESDTLSREFVYSLSKDDAVEIVALLGGELLETCVFPGASVYGVYPGQKGVIRIRVSGKEAFFTIKGERDGATCPEFEGCIPLEDAEEMLECLCGKDFIEKTRYLIMYKGHLWEVDFFEGANDGLALAEVELKGKDELVVLPPWIRKEVTGVVWYNNNVLIRYPFKVWGTWAFKIKKMLHKFGLVKHF